MPAVPASEIQKNFGEWADKAYEGPIEISRYGRTTTYLVSASFFREVMSTYRKAMPVQSLDESDLDLIRSAQVDTDEPYTLDEIPEVEAAGHRVPGR